LEGVDQITNRRLHAGMGPRHAASGSLRLVI